MCVCVCIKTDDHIAVTLPFNTLKDNETHQIAQFNFLKFYLNFLIYRPFRSQRRPGDKPGFRQWHCSFFFYRKGWSSHFCFISWTWWVPLAHVQNIAITIFYEHPSHFLDELLDAVLLFLKRKKKFFFLFSKKIIQIPGQRQPRWCSV